MRNHKRYSDLIEAILSNANGWHVVRFGDGHVTGVYATMEDALVAAEELSSKWRRRFIATPNA